MVLCCLFCTGTSQGISCSRPTPPANAYIYRGKLKEKYGLKEVVMFHCREGYRLSFVKCLTHGWSKTDLRCPPKNCSDPGTPANGRRQGDVFTFNSKVNFTCAVGYEVKGSVQRVCQENGTWSGTRTTCKRVECRDLGTPRNGVRRPDKNKYLYEDRIDFTCNTNYTLRGGTFITCLSDRTWTGTVPRCLAPCRDPGIPIGGRRNQHSFLHNKVVQFQCKRGWSMEGSRMIKCTNGRWDHATPTCSEGCSRLERPDNGGIYSNTWKTFYNYRDQVRFYCSRYYKLVGNAYATCRNGDWTSEPPECKRLCGNPGRPANGGFRGSEFFEGRELNFYCYGGYDLIGSPSQQCLSTGRWSAPRPECKRRCDNPRLSSNDLFSNPPISRGYRTKHGTTITFSCRPRYILEGRQTIRCDDGRWSHGVPACKAPCSDPGELPHGNKYGSSFLHGNHVSYTCLGLYILEGATRLTCNNGRWDPRKPSCKAPCPDPGSPAKGNKRGSDYRHGKSVSFTCQRGTRLVGRSSLTCNNGAWSHPLPTCLEICPRPSRLTNGRYLINGNRRWEYLSGDKVVYECYNGYDLVGNRELHCERGRWNGSAPVCADRCKIDRYPAGVNFVPTPREPGVSFLTPSKLPQRFRHGTVLTFSCNGSEVLNGPSEIFCNKGRWSKGFPKCEVPCKRLAALSNGKMRGSQFRIQSECDSGYTLVGSSVITCIQGQWSSDPPRCLRDCPNPNNLNNVRVTGSNYGHGQTVSFSCHNGFRLDGSSVLVCNDGRWNDTIPTCIGRCLNPGIPRHGRRRGDNFEHGQTVEFFCNQGQELFGDSRIQCNDGNWSRPTPTCEAGCPDPGVPEGMTRTGFSLRSRSSLTYSCIAPFHISGYSVITCKDGIWSESVPTCSDCASALGMESGKILDGNIQASSTRYRYHAKDGRLNGRYAWCSGTARDPYLQVDFGKPYRITGLATQGSAYDNRWVDKYTVTSNLAGSAFNMHREDNRDKIFIGNSDKGSPKRNKMKNPVVVRRLRIHPQKEGGFSALSPACMRVEIYGCDLPSDCIVVGSRLIAKWASYHVVGGSRYIYYKAYLTSISSRYWKVELENENHGSYAQKYFLKYEDLPFVLDVAPKHEELQVGTRVIAPWSFRYYSGTVKTGRDRYNRYRVRADDGDEKDFTIDQIRLLKAPTFCD